MATNERAQATYLPSASKLRSWPSMFSSIIAGVAAQPLIERSTIESCEGSLNEDPGCVHITDR